MACRTIAIGSTIHTLIAFTDLTILTVTVFGAARKTCSALTDLSRITITMGCAFCTCAAFTDQVVGTICVRRARLDRDTASTLAGLASSTVCVAYAICTFPTFTDLASGTITIRQALGFNALSTLANSSCITIHVGDTSGALEVLADLTTRTLTILCALWRDFAVPGFTDFSRATVCIDCTVCTFPAFTDLTTSTIAILGTLWWTQATTSLASLCGHTIQVGGAIGAEQFLTHLPPFAVNASDTCKKRCTATIQTLISCGAITVSGTVATSEILANLTIETRPTLGTLWGNTTTTLTHITCPTITVFLAINTLVVLTDLTSGTVRTFCALRLTTTSTDADFRHNAFGVGRTSDTLVLFTNQAARTVRSTATVSIGTLTTETKLSRPTIRVCHTWRTVVVPTDLTGGFAVDIDLAISLGASLLYTQLPLDTLCIGLASKALILSANKTIDAVCRAMTITEDTGTIQAQSADSTVEVLRTFNTGTALADLTLLTLGAGLTTLALVVLPTDLVSRAIRIGAATRCTSAGHTNTALPCTFRVFGTGRANVVSTYLRIVTVCGLTTISYGTLTTQTKATLPTIGVNRTRLAGILGTNLSIFAVFAFQTLHTRAILNVTPLVVQTIAVITTTRLTSVTHTDLT